MLNKTEILAFLKQSEGYQGNGTKEDVLSFCEKNAIEMKELDGTIVDIAKSFDAPKQRKTVLVVPNAGEQIEVQEADASDQLEVAPKSLPNKAKMATAQSSVARKDLGFYIGNAKDKAYNRKANAGKTIFGDADECRFFGSVLRTQIAKSVGKEDYRAKSRDMDVLGKDMNELSNTQGGAFLGEVLIPRVIALDDFYGSGPKLANNVDILGSNSNFPRETGPVALGFTQYSGTLTSLALGTDTVNVFPHQVGGYYPVSNQLWENSDVNMFERISYRLTQGYLKIVDDTYFNGDGTNTYAGMKGLLYGLESSNSYKSIGSGTGWANITLEDIQAAIANCKLIEPSRMKIACSWQFGQRVLNKLAMAAGGVSASEIVNGPRLSTFLQIPIVYTQVLPQDTASGQVCMYVGDFEAGSMIGQRNNFTVEQDKSAGFTSVSTLVRGVGDFGVNIHGSGQSGSTGPITGLKTN